MTTKIKPESIVEAMKKAMKDEKKPVGKLPLKVAANVTHRERDMRQEAIDIGSHGAKEMFGGKTGNE